MSRERNSKRTGVRASRIDWTEPPMELIGNLWYGPPGAMIPLEGGLDSFAGFLICCPGCGQLGSARDGAKWEVTGGTAEDVTTLTLFPSILKGCCGWHGYLRNGIFEVC